MPEEAIITEQSLGQPVSSIVREATISTLTFGIRNMSSNSPGSIIGDTGMYDYHISAVWHNEKYVGDVWVGNEFLAEDHINLSEIIDDPQVQQLMSLIRDVSLRVRKGTLPSIPQVGE